jgi:hypothetical protein
MEPFLSFADRLRTKVMQKHSINPIIPVQDTIFSLDGTKKSFESLYTTSAVKSQLDADLYRNSKSTPTENNMRQTSVSDPMVALHSNQITSHDSDVTMKGMD